MTKSLLSEALTLNPKLPNPQLNPGPKPNLGLKELTILVAAESKNYPKPNEQEISNLLEAVQDYATKFYLCDIMPDIDSLSQDKTGSLDNLNKQLRSSGLRPSEKLLKFVLSEVNEFCKFLRKINASIKQEQEKPIESRKDTASLAPKEQDKALDEIKKSESTIVIDVIDGANAPQSYKDAAQICFYKNLSKFVIEDYLDNNAKPTNIQQTATQQTAQKKMAIDFKMPTEENSPKQPTQPENSPKPSSHKSSMGDIFDMFL